MVRRLDGRRTRRPRAGPGPRPGEAEGTPAGAPPPPARRPPVPLRRNLVRVRPRPALGLAAAALAAVAVAALSAPPGALPTSESKLADKSAVKSFPVYDARGKRAGTAKWRLTRAGGNCCEVLVT